MLVSTPLRAWAGRARTPAEVHAVAAQASDRASDVYWAALAFGRPTLADATVIDACMGGEGAQTLASFAAITRRAAAFTPAAQEALVLQLIDRRSSPRQRVLKAARDALADLRYQRLSLITRRVPDACFAGLRGGQLPPSWADVLTCWLVDNPAVTRDELLELIALGPERVGTTWWADLVEHPRADPDAWCALLDQFSSQAAVHRVGLQPAAWEHRGLAARLSGKWLPPNTPHDALNVLDLRVVLGPDRFRRYLHAVGAADPTAVGSILVALDHHAPTVLDREVFAAALASSVDAHRLTALRHLGRPDGGGAPPVPDVVMPPAADSATPHRPRSPRARERGGR